MYRSYFVSEKFFFEEYHRNLSLRWKGKWYNESQVSVITEVLSSPVSFNINSFLLQYKVWVVKNFLKNRTAINVNSNVKSYINDARQAYGLINDQLLETIDLFSGHATKNSKLRTLRDGIKPWNPFFLFRRFSEFLFLEWSSVG